jgi:HSP20 family protein
MKPSNTDLSTSGRNPVSSAVRGIEFVSPVVDLHREAHGYRLDVEMAGVPKAAVDLTVEDGKLIITGHRNQPQHSGHLLHRERDQRDYRRVFDLDPTIDAGKIDASMDQGLLRIRLKKAEVHQPRKITVA